MNSDSSPRWPAPPDSDSLRREVVDIATEVMRGTRCAPGSARTFPADSSDQSAMNLYLALLTDRLPVFARTLLDLRSRIGEGDVEENLVPVGQATISSTRRSSPRR